MSGDLLRHGATFGKFDALKSLLEQGANPCSVDVFGLTALHYASWNGRIRCVKMLCINDIGRDKDGRQRSCIDMKSHKGYTALHLAALDGIEGVECINALLRAGARRELQDLDGNTAWDLASTAERGDCVLALEADLGSSEDIQELRKRMEGSLRFQKARLPADDALNGRKERRAPKPASLAMHEDDIVPFSETHFRGRHSKETIQSLVFAKEQASINEKRRRALAEARDNAFRQALDTKFI